MSSTCEFDSVCAEGLRCACATSGCEESACIEERDVGEPCSVDAQCPLSTRCEDGICKSSSIGFCAPP